MTLAASDRSRGSTGSHGGHGDDPRLVERLVVAPMAGRFRPLPPETFTTEGEIVTDGQCLGLVEAHGRSVEVRSFCTGFLMGMLAEPEQRVRAGQPVAWLRNLDGELTPWP